MSIEPHFTQAPHVVRRTMPGDVPAMVDFYRRNAQHLAPTSPRRPPNFGTPAFFREVVDGTEWDFAEGRRVSLILLHEAQAKMLGFATLMNVVRGAMQGCDLSYAIDAEYQGTGLMYWTVRCALKYAFGPMRLHRVQANHLPENERSARLLARLGFRREGYAERLLLIDGQWRDHVCNALVHDAWRPDPPHAYMLDG